MSILDIKENIENNSMILDYQMKQINKNVIIRTIHPVGQGAFYSERFIDKEDKLSHLMVYDCGGKNKALIEHVISLDIEKDDTIDILFISHFDNDHVNGLKYLKDNYRIKKVVMPLISPSDKWFYLINLSPELQTILLDSQTFFGNETHIVYVDTVKESNEEAPQDSEIVNIEALTSNVTIVSGTRLQASCNPQWCYIPFNYNEKERRSLLKKKLQEQNVDINRLENEDLNYIAENRSKINKAYNTICLHGANNSSLILYSGPIKESGTCKWMNEPMWKGEEWDEYFEELKEKGACLYLGDTDLNQQVVDNKNILDCLSSSLSDVSFYIGMIQVPHHGSICNFNNKILTMWNVPKYYFASYGITNKYRHPSSKVLAMIMRGNPFFGVTENRNSTATQLIFL